MVAQDGAADDRFGYSVAIDGDTMVIGAYGDDDKGSDSGSAYVFTRDVAGSLTAGWTQRAKVVAQDGAFYDDFGRSVAIDGDTVVIGAYEDDDQGSGSGSAYVFASLPSPPSPPPSPPPATAAVGATYGLAGYTEATFGAAERTAFVAALTKLLALGPNTARVTRVVNKYAAGATGASSSGRRRLTQVTGVDVDFVVDVLNLGVATSVGTQIDTFGSTSSATLVTELKSSGLTAVTDVTLSKGAATSAPPPLPLPPPLPSPPAPPLVRPPPPPPPEGGKLVEDYSSGGASTTGWRRSKALPRVLLTVVIAAVVATAAM